MTVMGVGDVVIKLMSTINFLSTKRDLTAVKIYIFYQCGTFERYSLGSEYPTSTRSRSSKTHSPLSESEGPELSIKRFAASVTGALSDAKSEIGCAPLRAIRMRCIFL